jgi:hypothetical protein
LVDKWKQKGEPPMNKTRIHFLSGVLTVLVLFSSLLEWAQPKAETKGPIITHAFAVEKGKLWIYFENLH